MKGYEYGALAPTQNAAVVAQQMLLAHRYHNALIELEHRRREEYEALMCQHLEYQILTDLASEIALEIEGVRTKIKAARQRTRRLVDTAALNAEVRALRELLATTRCEARWAKIEAKVRMAAPLAALNAADLVRRKAARAACGVFWGSYLIVEDAVEQAGKKSREAPRFKAWDGHGHLAVQIQHGMSAAEVFSCEDTRFQVEPKDWNSLRASGRRTTCRIRIGSNADKSPVWAEVPIFYHRPLPADAVIKRVHLLREPLAGRERWKVQLSVETAETLRVGPGHGAIGVDIGWRVVPEGLRVGYWCNSDGQHEQLVLDHPLLAALTKADSLRAIRDRNLNALRLELSVWLEQEAPALPPWFCTEAATIKLWRSARRFVRLVKLWNDCRFEGDGGGFTILAAWALQDRHLWTWEVHQRDKAWRRRREQYRGWAARLATQYSELVLEGEGETARAMDLRPLVRQAPPEGERDVQETARHNRVLAATSILRLCMIHAFQARGRMVRFRDKNRTTQECHLCGATFPRNEALLQPCCCGATWDQDENAARILVRAASAGSTSALGHALAAPKPAGSRWKRRKEKKRDRENGAAVAGCSQSGLEVAVAIEV